MGISRLRASAGVLALFCHFLDRLLRLLLVFSAVTHREGNRTITVAITGASGAIYAYRLLQLLDACSEVGRINLVVSESGRQVIAEELGIATSSPVGEDLVHAFGLSPTKVRTFPIDEIGAAIASGSHPVDAMVIIPCSGGTLAAVANGIAVNLIHRAAEVTLKENRRLILVVRETPLSAIHLENMLKLARLGATILPAMPAFYHRPKTIDDLVKHFVYRVLDHLELSHSQETVWQGTAAHAVYHSSGGS